VGEAVECGDGKITTEGGGAPATRSGNRLAGVDLNAIASACMKDHRLIDERSLALGAAIARGLEDHPSWIPHAQQTLERWLVTADPRVRPALLE